jgi:hypothetical protein
MADSKTVEDRKKAYDASLKGHAAFVQATTEALKRQRPRDADDLLRPPMTPWKGTRHISAGYFDYTNWLYRFDPDEKRSLDVNIASYRFQRAKHKDDVLAILDTIDSFKTGTALFDAIAATGHNLAIGPYWRFDHDLPYSNANNYFEDKGFDSLAWPRGKPDSKGQTDALIEFSPGLWNQPEYKGKPHFDRTTNLATGTAGITGPGSYVDEVLFHEIVHALRIMVGVSHIEEPVTAHYDNLEEYAAIVVSNIYLSEKRSKWFRADHSGFTTLPRADDFLKNVQHVNLSPGRLLDRLRHEHPKFFRELAFLPPILARWNPARDYAIALGLIPAPRAP